ITVSLLAVFIPILLMGGIVGRLFREFAVTLSIAVAVSAIVSLTLTPMMCARMLRHEGDHKRGFIDRTLERAFVGRQAFYDLCLRFVLRHRFTVGVLTLGTVGLTVYLYVFMPKGLFPQQDNGLVIGFSDAPQDISFPAMRERQEKLIKVMLADPDIDH